MRQAIKFIRLYVSFVGFVFRNNFSTSIEREKNIALDREAINYRYCVSLLIYVCLCVSQTYSIICVSIDILF